MTQALQLDSWPVSTAGAAVLHQGQWQQQGAIDTVFELASVTKLLAAYGFLIAMEEGVFELESTIEVRSPKGTFTPTVRELLSHAGGVGFSAQDQVREPQSRRVYSSYGFELLAAEVERVAEMPFAQYLKEAVFTPLAMHDSVLWGSAGHQARSTVQDLQHFAEELLRPRLLDASTLAEAFTIQFPELGGVVPGYGNHRPNPWGLGFEVHGSKHPHWLGQNMPEDVVGHFGQAGTYFWVHPKSATACVVLTDEPFGDWAKPLWQDANTRLWEELEPQL